VAVKVTAGQNVKFDTNQAGDLTQTLSTTSPTTKITTAINTKPVTAKVGSGSAVTYTISSASASPGTITATATGGAVDVTVNNQFFPVAQNSTVTIQLNLLPGDVDGSGRVDGLDLIALAAAFGSDTTKPSWNANADLDKNQVIDGSDLILLAMHFGNVQ
jgi:hypothetical protein